MSAIEVRNENGTGPIVLTSYGSVFNESYTIRGGEFRFEEVVAPGAFKRSLASRPDVVFRTEHSGPPLARTTNNTLRLSEDAVGLRYEAHLDRDDPDVQALVPKIRSGNLTESSFAFRVVRDAWSDDRSKRTMQELDIDRGDVSIVTFAASQGTGRHVQMSRHQGSDQERRAAAAAISASHLGGPGAMILRAGSWSNQHGSSCPDCEGSGACPTCDGQGWVPNTDGDDDSTLSAGRPNRTRAGVLIPRSRIPEFESALIAAQARSTEWAKR
jgi:hypothetical protein